MNYNELWINKYCPKNINNVIGNIDEINNIKKWLHNLNDNKSQSIIISGNKGVGKTLIIKLNLIVTSKLMIYLIQIKNQYNFCIC